MEYKITKEQVKAAYENKEDLKKLFPDAFSLEVGKWVYIVNGGSGAAGCNNFIGTVGHKPNKDLDNYCGELFSRTAEVYVEFPNGEIWGLCRGYEIRKATQDEIRTALLKEAERRGLTKGVKIKSPEPNANGVSKGIIEYQINYNNGTLFSSGLWLFKDGKWAEIISEPIELTLEEIAEKFGVSVEEIKIKK